MSTLELAQQYIDYLKEVGASPKGEFMNSAHPFAQNYKKVINGALILETGSDFKNHLKEITKVSEGWRIELADKIVANDNKICVVRYFLSSTNLGKFTTIAILRYNNDGLLEEVNEVYHPIS